MDQNDIYRFRTADSLIGDRKELYRQTIYLAQPHQLNDPAEGDFHVVWDGGEIVRNDLAKYYLQTLVYSMMPAIPGPQLEGGDNLRDVSLPGYHSKWLDPRNQETMNHMLNDLYATYNANKETMYRDLSNHRSAITSEIFIEMLSQFTLTGQSVIYPWEYSQLSSSPYDFPERFVHAMKALLLASDWRVACFTRDYRNPYLWSTYADNHAGVCLVFDRSELGSLLPPEGYPSVEIGEITYRHERLEMEFFDTVKAITFDDEHKPWVKYFYVPGYPHPMGVPFRSYDNEDGFIPTACRIVTRGNHQENHSRQNLLVKHESWAAEKEVRMFVHNSSGPASGDGPLAYTIQYPIRALKGIVFGMRTPAEDMDHIVEVILSKHHVQPMRDDFFFAMARSRPDGSIEMIPIPRYEGWRQKLGYPR